MTRLVAAELRKVWRSRFFLVALAALLGVLLVVPLQAAKVNTITAASSKLHIFFIILVIPFLSYRFLISHHFN